MPFAQSSQSWLLHIFTSSLSKTWVYSKSNVKQSVRCSLEYFRDAASFRGALCFFRSRGNRSSFRRTYGGQRYRRVNRSRFTVAIQVLYKKNLAVELPTTILCLRSNNRQHNTMTWTIYIPNSLRSPDPLEPWRYGRLSLSSLFPILFFNLIFPEPSPPSGLLSSYPSLTSIFWEHFPISNSHFLLCFNSHACSSLFANLINRLVV